MANASDTFKWSLANLLRARFIYIYIPTWEEERVVAAIKEVAHEPYLVRTPRVVYEWSQASGLVNEEGKEQPGTRDAGRAIDFICKCDDDAVFLLKDFHTYFGSGHRPADATTVRKLRDALPTIKNAESRKNVIFISPTLAIPEEMQKDISILDFPLPSEDELKGELQEIIDENEGLIVDIDENGKADLARAAVGLTMQEAENAFSRAIITNGRLDMRSMPIIFQEKNQVIKKNGILEFIETDLKREDIGGLENLKKWLDKRNNSWSEEARSYHVPAPKGVLITGVPGCGKSLTAKAMSSMWNLPLLKMDFGKIFSGIVGSSEENMRRALSTAEAVAPSILWVDEIEKGLGGASGGGGDSGTSVRVFGTFLTWMQEKKSPVFVVATANDISSLPPELLRKGRFDEIFFVDLPTKKERMDIFKLHLDRRLAGNEFLSSQITVSDDLLERLADETEGYVGAEIEQAVIDGLYEAFFDRRPLHEEDLFRAVRNTVPLSVTQAEHIRSLRAWASVRAVAATPKSDKEEYSDAGSEGAAQEPDDIKKSRGGRGLDF